MQNHLGLGRRKFRRLKRPLFGVCLLCLAALAPPPAYSQSRWGHSLAGIWQLSSDQGLTWTPVTVPGTFEQQIAPEFDGAAWLRRQVPSVPRRPDQRLVVHFEAVATACEVFVDGQKVGAHLGGWTPFRIDVTDAVPNGTGSWELMLHVDEKVGHNTQGFLPIITRHFGGVWQDVRLLSLPATWLDDLRCLAVGDVDRQAFCLELPTAGGGLQAHDVWSLAWRAPGSDRWSNEVRVPAWARHDAEVPMDAGGDRARVDSSPPPAGPPSDGVTDRHAGTARRWWLPLKLQPDAPAEPPCLWTPGDPRRYALRVQLWRKEQLLDEQSLAVAFRKVATDGRRLLLNDQPLAVRGLLNWGYQPGFGGPTADDAVMQRELEFARERGFNLMKFCLWCPPRRYLELADSLGMLVWMEYPAWHPQFKPEFLGELRGEYDEFFLRDRNHPGILLRSLTCETGPSADLAVLQELYDLCHQRIPGALVEDDSSWISWNRVHDFYDDHPYGNNHTWPAKLDELNHYISARRPLPLMLGEAIAADTWYGPPGATEPARPSPEPPIFAAANRSWLSQMEGIVGDASAAAVHEDSLRYALLMRKHQIEAYRREVPHGGYVVSVIRDFPLASMGLIDDQGRPKWTAEEWSWHGDTMLLLHTADDRRSLEGGQPLEGDLLVSHFGGATLGELQVQLALEGDAPAALPLPSLQLVPGSLTRLPFSLPTRSVQEPVRVVLAARLTSGGQTWRNAWPIWLMPRADIDGRLRCHPSLEAKLPVLGLTQLPKAGDSPRDAVVLTQRLDRPLLDFMGCGGRVLLLPDDQAGSFPVQDHWFLRGGPLVHADIESLVPRQLLVELQHFDLAGGVVPELQGLVEHGIRPLVSLWDNHDLPRVKTHGLVFEIPVGQGWLMVSALDHRAGRQAAGPWLLQAFARRLASLAGAESHGGNHNQGRFERELTFQLLPLEQPWRFQPDPRQVGHREGWHRKEMDDRDWPEIRVQGHWESQGYEALDGWAWYRLQVKIPDGWPAGRGFLNFTGVDDYYRLYVNGEPIGTGGDLERRLTAFEERKSHDIGSHVAPGGVLQVAVEVYDWQGAGGIFRPVSISTTALDAEPRWLK